MGDERAEQMNEPVDMNERIHRYLDGELPLSELMPDEVARVRRLERAVAALRADGARFRGVDLASRVMQRIQDRTLSSEPRRSKVVRMREWLLAGRRVSFTLRPIYVAAAAVLVLVAGLQWDLASPLGEAAPTASAEQPPAVFVRFEVDAPDAHRVELAGSFSNWSPDISLTHVSGDRWIAFVPLRPGVHDYAFRVDGERWVVDPGAPRVADGFGGFNSRLSLVLADG